MDAVDKAVSLSTAKNHLAVLISEQAYSSLQGHQSKRGVWSAIANWRAVATQEIKAWRDRSSDREVQLG